MWNTWDLVSFEIKKRLMFLYLLTFLDSFLFGCMWSIMTERSDGLGTASAAYLAVIFFFF